MPARIDTNGYSFQYLHGVNYGDGYASKRVFQLRAVDSDFLDEFENHLKKLGFKPRRRLTKSVSKQPCFDTYVCNTEFCKMINKSAEMSIPFINGIIDSEATVGTYNFGKYTHYTRIFRIAIINKKLLIEISTFLKLLDIPNKIYERKQSKKSYKPDGIIFALEVRTRKGFKNLHKHFHFSIKRKQITLNQITQSYRYKEVNQK